ncbi:MAG: AraC family transcriptional regulator [Micromonosporaceae bacterium]
MTPSAGYQAAEYAVWTRVGGPTDRLDLLSARFRCHRYAPHTHEEYALGVCVDGVESIRYRGATHYAGPGSVVVLEPGEAHTGAPALDSGFAYRSIYPPARVLADGQARQPHFRDAVIGDPELAQAFLSAHVALTRGDHLEGEVRLVEALGDLVCRHAIDAPARDRTAGQRLVQAVMTRLADQVVNPPTLTEISADVGISRYHLVRAFCRSAGMPPYAWLAQHRVARARTLLDAGWAPADVAGHVGFADQAHMTRWFRRVIGVTPGVYRNSVQDSRGGRRRD